MTVFRLDGPAERAGRAVEASLGRAARESADAGLGVPEISGKLLRPMVAWALAADGGDAEPCETFGLGALAIQMVHEASLLHDDILDGADHRRGAPATHLRDGVDAALITGDRWLTSAYVVASRTGSADFVSAFARAVERTVAGEMRQGASRGQTLTEDAYEAIIRGKSGELFGAAALLASVVTGRRVPAELGLRIGSLYQRIDDLLDYCTEIQQDKPPLQDWRQRKWTFPLGLAGVTDWNRSESDVLRTLRSGPDSALEVAVRDLETRAASIVEDASKVLGDATLLECILDSWCSAARTSVEHELAEVRRAELPAPIHRAS